MSFKLLPASSVVVGNMERTRVYSNCQETGTRAGRMKTYQGEKEAHNTIFRKHDGRRERVAARVIRAWTVFQLSRVMREQRVKAIHPSQDTDPSMGPRYGRSFLSW